MPLKTFHVLVTGSRGWPQDRAYMIDTALDEAVEIARKEVADLLLVRHGAAEGVDTMASNWVKRNPVAQHWMPVVEEIHRPAWDIHGRPAGHIRNAQMVNMGAELCLAFIKDESAGATGCLQAAGRAGIVTWIWRL
jgi:hypothetical protein